MNMSYNDGHMKSFVASAMESIDEAMDERAGDPPAALDSASVAELLRADLHLVGHL